MMTRVWLWKIVSVLYSTTGIANDENKKAKPFASGVDSFSRDDTAVFASAVCL